MRAGEGSGWCESCSATFRYEIVDSASSDTCFGYCDRCGTTALVRITGVTDDPATKERGPCSPAVQARLRPCACGGRFKSTSPPRCPTCRSALSAQLASIWIERNARGSRGGWRWQRSWRGTCAIVIGGRVADDPWRDEVKT